MVYLIATIVVGTICGFVTKSINESKGYYGGFAWGFFLGVIGIIVVACRQDCVSSSYGASNYLPNSEMDERIRIANKESEENRLIREGGWRCNKCNKVNPRYQSTCDCGMIWTKNKDYLEEQKKLAETNSVQASKEELKSYKEMLDEGLITQEEFDAKKKQLLGI